MLIFFLGVPALLLRCCFATSEMFRAKSVCGLKRKNWFLRIFLIRPLGGYLEWITYNRTKDLQVNTGKKKVLENIFNLPLGGYL